MDKMEHQFYEIATNEIASKTPVKSIYGKAFSDAMGDKEKTAALYIQYRVEQLEQEFADRLQEEEAKNRDRRGFCPRCKTLNPPDAFRCKNEACLDILPQSDEASFEVCSAPHLADSPPKEAEVSKDTHPHTSSIDTVKDDLSAKRLIKDIVRKTSKGVVKELIKLLLILVLGGFAVGFIADRIPRSYRQSSPILLILLLPTLRKILISPTMEAWFKEMYLILAPHMGGVTKVKPVDVFAKVFIILFGLVCIVGVIIYVLWLLLAHKL